MELKQSQYDFNSTLSSDDDSDEFDDLLYPSTNLQHVGHNASGGGGVSGVGNKDDVGDSSRDNNPTDETGLSPRSKYIDSCIR